MLDDYRAAADAVQTFERETSGAPWEEQSQIEERHGLLSDAMYEALRRLLRTPAPDIRAVALKLELTVEHEVGTLTGGEDCLDALRRDAWRLAGKDSGA